MTRLPKEFHDLIAKARLAPIDWERGAREARRRFWRAAHSLETGAPALLDVRPMEALGAAGPLPARLYVPFAAGLRGGLLVYFHGGGFVSGDLDSHDMICRRLAAAAGLRILSVAYRLAPAHKWPCAPDDAVASLRWAQANADALGVDPLRVAVGGDSAGGALAAIATLVLRGQSPPLRAQLLIYPCTQLVAMPPTQLFLKEERRVTQAAQDWVRDAYLPDRDAALDWRASPLLAPDHRGLPPAFVLTAGIDPLRDEGLAYADKLAASGVVTLHRDHPGQMHGFFNMTVMSPAAREAIVECGRWLAAALAA